MNDKKHNPDKDKGSERIIGGRGPIRENQDYSEPLSGEWVMSDRPVPGPPKPQENNDGKPGS